MTTISRNSNAFKSAIASAQEVRCYELSSCFEGYATSGERLREAAAKGGKLTKMSASTYSLRIHSNRWYEFRAI